jgi:3-carboxy-cis,cis-muconate cycloisomerase
MVLPHVWTDGVRAERGTPSASGWNLLFGVFGDPVIDEIFGQESTVEAWLRAERALALAEAEVGLLTEEDAAAIAKAAQLTSIDFGELWRQTHNVGYPILPLIRMVAAAMPEGPNGRVHYGATTQDIMDTGLVLQLGAAIERVEGLLEVFGAQLADLVRQHVGTVMAARTHALQAVPTTLGAKFSVVLSELARHRTRLGAARERVRLVSLFGAGGTAASLGTHASEVRQRMAQHLGLRHTNVPWHVARDGIAEVAEVCTMLAATSARLAQEVINLQRTEVAEVAEATGYLRGASSTMPQKANPVSSEVVVGSAAYAASLSSSFYRAMTPSHERAAGEWHIEWVALPAIIQASATCLLNAAEIVNGLQVDPVAMRRNLRADSGLVMSEAYMMRLAAHMGRENAHDLVYAAALDCRRNGVTLADAVRRRVEAAEPDTLDGLTDGLGPADYLGSVQDSCDEALRQWEESR